MLKVYKSTIFAWASCLISTPFFLVGALSPLQQEQYASLNHEDVINKKSLGCCSSIKKNIKKSIQPLELKDFKGDWIVSAQSTGGLAGPDKIGSAQSITSQMTIDRDGKGVINYGVITTYRGIAGVTENSIKNKLYDLEIEILDAKKGVVTLFFDGPLPDPVVKSISKYFAVVNRCKKTGKVTEIIGQRIQREPSTETNLLTVKMSRQFGAS